MQTMILISIRLYLLALKMVAPKTAGRQAFRLFSTPRTRRRVPSSVEDVMARAQRLQVQADGEDVAVYRWQPPKPKGADVQRVILVHGWESRGARLAVWVEPLLKAGFEVVTFDAPAHGASSGRRAMPPSFVYSMAAIEERLGPIYGCVGHSLGGLSAILSISADHFLNHSPLQIQRLVVLAGADSGTDAMGMFCDVLGLGRSFLPLVLGAAAEEAGHPISDFDGHRVFAEHALPTLWFHDPEDDDVPIEAARRVVDACPHVTFEVTEGLGHHHIARDPGIIERGVAFLQGEAS